MVWRSTKKYSELVKWFLEKDYECLEENLKCIKEVLNNEAKKQGGALKNICEDFVSCFDGSERGAYPESTGESAGILSLEYNNSASVIDNVTQITNRLIAQKRAALEDLSKTINCFSSIFCSVYSWSEEARGICLWWVKQSERFTLFAIIATAVVLYIRHNW